VINLLKKGFTIAELVISLVIMMIISASVLPILLKKAKQSDYIVDKDKKIVCSCRDGENEGGSCEFEIKDGGGEFYTVQLLGGGAGGATMGGGAGEGKVIHYPALIGKFKIVLGKGGGSGQNGGITALYKENDDGTYKLLEFARGGVINNQPDDPEMDGAERDKLKKGEEPTFNESAEKDTPGVPAGPATPAHIPCGKGGDASSAGLMGEVIIRW